jgi:hypothetical protein
VVKGEGDNIHLPIGGDLETKGGDNVCLPIGGDFYWRQIYCLPQVASPAPTEEFILYSSIAVGAAGDGRPGCTVASEAEGGWVDEDLGMSSMVADDR